MIKRKIAIFTGNRAEYGLQYPIIRALTDDERFKCYLIVSGAHLDDNFGCTVGEIKKDGFKIYATVDIPMKGDTLFDTAQAIGSGILNLSGTLKKLKPDVFIVYADRFEGFSAVITATQMGIPVCHVEGGDVTEGGALDDMVRHSMSKLAHLHFTTNEEASRRLIRMGEEPWRVFNVGFPGIDLINDGSYACPEEIRKVFGVDPEKPFVLFTQHSIATEFDKAMEQIRPAIKALLRLAEYGIQVIITFPNNDAGSRRVIKELRRVGAHKRKNIQVHKSLGRYYYYGLLNICGRTGIGVCVGNSSSGIKETPAFGCPTVNIGERQKGRLRAGNILDVRYDADKIYQAVMRCLTDKDFRKRCAECHNPYGTGGTGKKIADILAAVKIDLELLQKKMTY